MKESQKYKVSGLKPLKNHMYLIQVDNQEYKLHEETVLKYRLVKDKEFSDLKAILLDNENNIMYAKIRSYAIRYPKSTFEMQTYLTNKYDLDIALASSMVKRLEEEKILDDKLYQESVVNSLINKGYGKNYIYNVLRAKGLDTDIEISDDSLAIEHLIEKQLKNYSKLDKPKQKEKIINYLMRKGYSYSLIKSKLEAYF